MIMGNSRVVISDAIENALCKLPREALLPPAPSRVLSRDSLRDCDRRRDGDPPRAGCWKGDVTSPEHGREPRPVRFSVTFRGCVAGQPGILEWSLLARTHHHERGPGCGHRNPA